ncbi:MAG TPA: hypothetical protein EYO58_09855, partial [Flavobacteriales bacterium]|nr:hypothetical protein [Flavobacteriales bacterium]
MRGYKQQDAQELLYTLQQRWEDELLKYKDLATNGIVTGRENAMDTTTSGSGSGSNTKKKSTKTTMLSPLNSDGFDPRRWCCCAERSRI